MTTANLPPDDAGAVLTHRQRSRPALRGDRPARRRRCHRPRRLHLDDQPQGHPLRHRPRLHGLPPRRPRRQLLRVDPSTSSRSRSRPTTASPASGTAWTCHPGGPSEPPCSTPTWSSYPTTHRPDHPGRPRQRLRPRRRTVQQLPPL